MGASSPGPGERKIVTILFADVVGSTALGDEEDPERTRRLLERFYDLTSSQLESAGGTVEKFAGDAVMAVFGYPLAQEDHADRALDAALGIQQAIAADLPALELRIGINSGEVVVGESRAGSAFISGDAVNLAARLEQRAEPGRVLVGSRTAAAARGSFVFGPEMSLDVKGKREPVRARELRAAASGPPPMVRLRSSTFVGREAELEELRSAWSRVVAAREPRRVTVIGEPGIGKSSFVRQGLAWLESHEPAPVYRSGRCLAYGKGSTYWPLADVLRDHFAIPRTATTEEILAALHGREMLGMALGLEVADGLHPLAARERHHDAWIDFLEDITANAPTVVLIEDVHWAEDPLVQLLDELAREVRGPLMLLTTARPEFVQAHPGWLDGRLASVVWLEPLSSDDADSMLGRLLDGDVPPGLSQLVLERAEGNPFFVEELLESLIDRGLLRQIAGTWRLLEHDGIALPDSVRSVLAARIDLLDPLEKAALQAASVAGRTFASAAVVDLLEGRQPDLRLLEERGFVRRFARASAGEREYMFKHALTRDVAYASVAKRQRGRLHAAFAERLERIGETGDQYAFLLAHHYWEAVRPEDADLVWADDPERLAHLTARAAEWLQQAGRLAAGRFAIDDGLVLLDRALRLDLPEAVQGSIWRSIGRTHALRYAGRETIAAYERSAELTADLGLRAEILAELVLEVVQRYGMLDPMPTRELVDGWIDRALALAPPDGTARAKALVARASWSIDAREAALEAVRIAEDLGDPDLVSLAYSASAGIAFSERRYDDSVAWAEQRLALQDLISDPDHRVDILSAPIPGLLGRARFDEARAFVAQHDEAASRLSTHHQMHAVAMRLEVEELTGRWDLIRALEDRTRGAVAANALTPCVRNANSLFVCAVAAAMEGDEERSRELEAWAERLEMQGWRGTLAPARIRLALHRGELESLPRLVEEAVAPPAVKNWWPLGIEAARLDGLAALGARVAVETEAPAFVVGGTYLEPFALRALGVVQGDQSLIDQAAQRFEAMGLGWHARQTDSMSARGRGLPRSGVGRPVPGRGP